MKKLLHHLVYVCLLIILFSCNHKPSNGSKANSTFRSVSDSYKAPVYLSDNRIEEIKKAGPEIQRIIEDHAKENHIPGSAYGIVVDNELILASATGFINLENKVPATIASSFRIASMTKSFTAMAIIKLRDEGKLSLNDPVSKFIPEMLTIEYLTDDAPIIDIENLLTMTAGFPEDNPWGDRQLDESDQMLMDLIQEGILFSNPPSYEFEYSNTGYALLGDIISRVSGIPYQSYIQEYILEPLGMDQTYWEYDSVPEKQLALGYRWEDEQWKLEPMLHDGVYGAMGGLITSIEDFSKYVSYLLAAWPPRSGEDAGPVKRSSLREMQTPQFSRLYANTTDFQGDPCAVISGYGFGLGIGEDCHGLKSVSHGGALPGFGSNYMFYPDYGIGIMAFCNLTYTSPWPYYEIGELLFEDIDFKPMQLPVSDIMLARQKQLVGLIQSWDPALEQEILAENFFLDFSREDRMTEVRDVLSKAGAISSVEEVEPENQLRGSFKLITEKGIVSIFFTLTPNKSAKIQELDVTFRTD